MRPLRAKSQLLALLAVTSLLALGFHQLGSHPAFAFEWSLSWLEDADPENALLVLLRATGLTCCYWVLISTTLYALAHRTGRAPGVIRWTTAPLIRRLVDRALAASLAISALAVPTQPLMAAADPEPVIVLEIHGDGIPVPHLRMGSGPSPVDATSSPAAETTGTTNPSLRQPGPVIATTRPGTRSEPPATSSYLVRPGDNLWRVAATRVQAASRSEATERMVAAYWRQLIDANIASLRSGDPNLIYPGEILTMPRLEVQP